MEISPTSANANMTAMVLATEALISQLMEHIFGKTLEELTSFRLFRGIMFEISLSPH